jgi:hypothetical protein
MSDVAGTPNETMNLANSQRLRERAVITEIEMIVDEIIMVREVTD